jgi:hypothetical protein
VVIERAPRTGFGVATRPDTDVDGIEGFAASQRALGEQRLQACGADLADRERIGEAAPAMLMLRLHAQQWQRGDGSCRQQGVAQLEERVSSTPTGCVGRSAKGGQRGKMSGFSAKGVLPLAFKPTYSVVISSPSISMSWRRRLSAQVARCRYLPTTLRRSTRSICPVRQQHGLFSHGRWRHRSATVRAYRPRSCLGSSLEARLGPIQ